MEDCGCENKCFSQLPLMIREHIYGSYQKLITHNEKYLYLSGLVYKENLRKEKSGPKTFLFHVRVSGCNIKVCRKAFETVHGVSSSDVGKLLKKLKNNVISLGPDDELFLQRVKVKSHMISTSAKINVIKHIEATLLRSDVSKVIKLKKHNFEKYRSV